MTRSPESTRKRHWAIPALMLTVLLSGCGLTLDTLGTGVAVTPLPVEPTTVSRGTIISVVTFTAEAVAGPEYVLVAEQRATVQSARTATPGTAVKEGQLIGWMGGRELRAPTDAIIVEWLAAGATVNQGVPVVVLRYGGFGAFADVPIEQAFRLYEEPSRARVQFDGAAGVSECSPYTPRPPSAPSTSGVSIPMLTILCLIDDRAGLIAGMRGKIALDTGVAENALRLPIGAVAGSTEFGQVALVTTEGTRIVEVELGISDGVWVEVRAGLNDGDRVLPHGPNLAQEIVP